MRRSNAVLVLFGFVGAACGGGITPGGATDPGAASTPPTTVVTTGPTEPPTTSASPPTSQASTLPAETTTTSSVPTAAASLVDVQSAVVRIVGTGTFADPFGSAQPNATVSGFIIDPSGIAVTTDHVVTGATSWEVYVAGDPTPHQAQVVGVAECSDLAVIDIDGDGFAFLDWYDGPVNAGMEIYAAGFPEGDERYAVLDGIVSSAGAAGATPWAAVDAVIEHSADTSPGNSGGPIVTVDGAVVAVHAATDDIGRSVAIGTDVVRPAVETLRTGVDLASIGINGEAWFDALDNGVWVHSVEPGSPADLALVHPGDLITTMEAVALGADGTLTAYCDILRSRLPTDVLAIEVYRAASDQLLSGQINGEPLAVTVSFETEFDEFVTADPTGGYSDYQAVTDDSMMIEFSAPLSWADTDGRQWESTLAGSEDLIGPALSASPDIAAFTGTWTTPGVFVGASALIPLTVQETIDSYSFGDSCTFEGRYPYADGRYTGLYDVYTNCDGTGNVFFQTILEPLDQTWIASIQMVAVTTADLVAADHILASLTVQPLAG